MNVNNCGLRVQQDSFRRTQKDLRPEVSLYHDLGGASLTFLPPSFGKKHVIINGTYFCFWP